MVINDKDNNRCGIFLFYDRDGIVDDYIVYMLRDLKKSLKYLLTVCNGRPSDKGLEILEEISDEVLVRANSGFDVGGYREGLFHLGFKELNKYDEIVMLNYTFFGSVYPFAEAFAKMSTKDLDFWGLTKHHKVDPDPFGKISYGYLPEHIQSHFMVLRRSLFETDDYKEFIISMKNPSNYLDSICDYETVMTKIFEDKGYKWDVYVDSSRFEGYAYSPVMFKIKDLLIEDRCPIIKRRSFFTDYNDYLLNTCGESSVEAYDYLCDNVDYDVNMIWDNILRLENMTEVSKVMQLNYCNSSQLCYGEECVDDVNISIWVKSIECIEFYKRYLKSLSPEHRVTLYGEGNNLDAVCELLQSDDVKKVESPISSIREFLIEVKHNISAENEYIICCIMDDKGEVRPYSNKLSNMYKDWNCLLVSPEYISNLRDTFIENVRMGIGIPPVPEFGEYLPMLGDGWMGKFGEVKEYITRLGIIPNIKENIPPLFPMGGNFVIRKEILGMDVFDRALTEAVDDNVLMLSMVEIVRSCGYYTGTLYSDNYAEIEITNSDYMLREMNKAVFEMYGPSYFSVVRDRVANNELLNPQPPVEVIPTKKQMLKSKVKNGIKKVTPEKVYKFGGRVYRKIRRR